ncbi:Rrp15p-domain-containing protein [Calycina marina]|uniref:Rrp15p-domain-containing protein n=1 Tax=Calycina marina TaxID=1763456 RepID=A0A9P7YWK1_9HELO|nr:Rrp15p-domain-containing protein [Calycina marina]
MAGQYSKKRKAGDDMKGKPKKTKKSFKRQTDYDNDSTSESEAENTATDFKPVNLQESDDGEESNNAGFCAADEPVVPAGGDDELEITDASNSDSESDSNSDDGSDTESNPNLIRKRKRNDPEAFALSMTKILGSKLATSKRSDPVLARSVTAIEASKEMTDLALEKKAKNKLREEKKAALDKGRVKDVLGASTVFDSVTVALEGVAAVHETLELERRLKKTAQRGVIKLFSAVRAAQVKGEKASKEIRTKGLVGHGRREEKVNEMSKQGFLELIAGGGSGLTNAGGIEEA